MIRRFVAIGLAAGAAGTTALNAVTYADMVFRGRAASELPQRSVELLADRAGLEIPGEGQTRKNRIDGLGALSGIGAGLSVGVLASALRPILRHMPRPIASLLVGGVAMAATDAPLSRLGLTDLKSWTTADWLSDAVPHLAYGAATVAVLRASPIGNRSLNRPSRHYVSSR